MLSSGGDTCSLCGCESARSWKITWRMDQIIDGEYHASHSIPLHEFCLDCAERVKARLFAAVESIVAVMNEEYWNGSGAL